MCRSGCEESAALYPAVTCRSAASHSAEIIVHCLTSSMGQDGGSAEEGHFGVPNLRTMRVCGYRAATACWQESSAANVARMMSTVLCRKRCRALERSPTRRKRFQARTRSCMATLAEFQPGRGSRSVCMCMAPACIRQEPHAYCEGMSASTAQRSHDYDDKASEVPPWKMQHVTSHRMHRMPRGCLQKCPSIVIGLQCKVVKQSRRNFFNVWTCSSPQPLPQTGWPSSGRPCVDRNSHILPVMTDACGKSFVRTNVRDTAEAQQDSWRITCCGVHRLPLNDTLQDSAAHTSRRRRSASCRRSTTCRQNETQTI